MKNIIKSIVNQKTFHLKSQGSSMLPLLQPDDIVYFKKSAFSRIEINDLVMVKKGQNLFTHRIVYKTSKYAIAKGDNNLESDGNIYPNQIIGKVYQVKRDGRIFNPESLYLLQSTLYFQEIVKIKKAFEREKIDFVFLKGLPLHLYFEKTHPRRIYLDCDVLIKKQDFIKAQTILRKYNYRKSDNLLSNKIKRNIGEEMEISYYKLLNGFSITFDLHFEVDITIVHLNKLDVLYPQKMIDQLTQELLHTKKTVKIQNESFSILNSSFFILYLALHFFHHNYQGTFRLEFIDKVIRHSGDPERSRRGLQNPLQGKRFWTSQNDKIQKYHLQNFVYPVFVLLRKYYQTPIPFSFLKGIQPNFINFMNFIDFKNLNIFDDEPRVKAGVNRFKNLFFLSPGPLWKKVFIFVNPQVLYSIFWVAQRKLFSYFPNRK